MSMGNALYDGYSQGTVLTAQDLNGRHIGDVISLKWTEPVARIKSVVIAELRQISHSASETVINVTAHDEDTGGSLAEMVLMPDHRIVIMERV